MSTAAWQRLEASALALAVAICFVVAGHAWWWLLLLFLVFDLSALGYLAGPRVGAAAYNVVHSWAGPAVLIAVAVCLRASGSASAVLEVIAGSWAFHVAVDRALGYGLKEGEGFHSTHLGPLRGARGPGSGSS